MSKTRAEALAETPFSLSLSSGFFGFFAHLGFMKAFAEKALKPNALSGSSAGALVAAGVASGKSAEELQQIFLKVQKDDFWDPSWGFGYLKGEKLEQLMQDYCSPHFSQTEIPLHISVFNIKRRRTEVVTTGSVAQACRASAAVPFMFHPVKISNDYYWDGGIGDRPGHRGVKDNGSTQVMHYLLSGDLVNKIEGSMYPELKQNPFVFMTPRPFKMGPSAMDKGPEVIQHFHKVTKAWLEAPL